MLKWKKTGRVVRADGGSTITYEAKGKRAQYVVESRKNPIAHASGSGSWMYTTYFLITGGQERKFFQLRSAKQAAEEMEAAEC